MAPRGQDAEVQRFVADALAPVTALLESIARNQRTQADLMLAEARASVLEGFSTGAQNAPQPDGVNYKISVSAQSGNNEVIQTVIAYTGGGASTLTVGTMKLILPTGITRLSGLRLPLSPIDERSISDTGACKMSLWLLGYEAPNLRFSTQ
jgi:hypothetical protein